VRRIYLAGRFSDQKKLRVIRSRIECWRELTVISSWLDVERDAQTPAEHVREAGRDFYEVRKADLFILDTTEPTRRGGRETELGIALASGVEAWIVGPYRQVFHYALPQFDTWDEALDALVKEAIAA
jgi:hypothetical protein